MDSSGALDSFDVVVFNHGCSTGATHLLWTQWRALLIKIQLRNGRYIIINAAILIWIILTKLSLWLWILLRIHQIVIFL